MLPRHGAINKDVVDFPNFQQRQQVRFLRANVAPFLPPRAIFSEAAAREPLRSTKAEPNGYDSVGMKLDTNQLLRASRLVGFVSAASLFHDVQRPKRNPL